MIRCPLSTLRRHWWIRHRRRDVVRVLYVLTREHPEPVEFHQLCTLAKLPAVCVESALTTLEMGPFVETYRAARGERPVLNDVKEMVSLTKAGWTTFNADVWRP